AMAVGQGRPAARVEVAAEFVPDSAAPGTVPRRPVCPHRPRPVRHLRLDPAPVARAVHRPRPATAGVAGLAGTDPGNVRPAARPARRGQAAGPPRAVLPAALRRPGRETRGPTWQALPRARPWGILTSPGARRRK